MSMEGSSLVPSLLLAMPQLLDPNFERSVILLCEHGEAGAMGFVVNRPTEFRAADAMQLDPPLQGDSGLCLWTGGPVETHRGFLLLGSTPRVDESERINDDFHLTSSLDVLRSLLEGGPDGEDVGRCRLLLGYAGWGPGQLDAELAASSWLSAPADPALVFGSEPMAMWDRAIRGLGVDPMALTPAPGLQ